VGPVQDRAGAGSGVATVSRRLQQYVDLAAEGFTHRAIAERLGVSHSSVSKALARAGVTSKHRAPPANKVQPSKELLEQWRVKLSTREVTRLEMAAHFGVSTSTVCRWIEPVGAKSGPRPGSPGMKSTAYIRKPPSDSEVRSQQRRDREAKKRAALLAEMGAQR